MTPWYCINISGLDFNLRSTPTSLAFGTWKLSGKGKYFPLTNFISSTTCSSNQILNATRLIVPESFHFGYECIIVHISLCHNLDGVFYCEVDLVGAYVHLEVTNALAQGDVSKFRGKYY